MSEAIPSWARVGAKVVCINDVLFGENFSSLREGDVYTIHEVIPSHTAIRWDGKRDNAPSLVLVESVNPFSVLGGYDIRRFRPLVSQSDDIAAHFAYLLDTRAPELV